MITTLFKSIAYTCLCIFVLVACNQVSESNKAIKNEDFNALCMIYQAMEKVTADLPTMEATLAEKVQNKLPALFNKLFIHVNNNNAEQRYQLIQQYAQQQNQISWECEPAKVYYTVNFKQGDYE